MLSNLGVTHKITALSTLVSSSLMASKLIHCLTCICPLCRYLHLLVFRNNPVPDSLSRQAAEGLGILFHQPANNGRGTPVNDSLSSIDLSPHKRSVPVHVLCICFQYSSLTPLRFLVLVSDCFVPGTIRATELGIIMLWTL